MKSAGVQKMALESVGIVVTAVCCHGNSSRVYKRVLMLDAGIGAGPVATRGANSGVRF